MASITRDIRQDLRERIELATAERDGKHRELAALDNHIQNLQTVLSKEESAWGTSLLVPPSLLHPAVHPLRDILMDLLQDGGIWSGAMLARYAVKQGYNFGTASPGRATHSTLISMARNLQVLSVGEGKWKILGSSHTEDQTLEGAGE